MRINEENIGIKPLIIPVCGKARNGKDFTAGKMEQAFRSIGANVQVVHYADELKRYCKDFFGWNGEKDETGRKLLQFVGTEVYRSKDQHYWVKRLMETFDNMTNDDFVQIGDYSWKCPDVIIIPDARFPNEIMCWVARGYPVVPTVVCRMDYFFTEDAKPDQKDKINGSYEELIKAAAGKQIRFEVFKNDLNDEAQKHPSETALDPFVFDVDGHGLNKNLRTITEVAGDSFNDTVAEERNNIYYNTACQMMRFRHVDEMKRMRFITSELKEITFDEHFNNVFLRFIEDNMMLLNNVSGCGSMIDKQVTKFASDIFGTIRTARAKNTSAVTAK